MVNLGSSKDKGKVSVVVTFCNLDNVAGRMLNSLVNQTYKNLEIVCVNDNSTDKTLEILNEFAKNDDRVVVINNKENCGASKSRNIGIDHSTGKFLIVIDGDDEMLLDGIENMVNAFDDKTDCVVAGFKQVSKDGAINFVMPEERVSGSPKNEEFFERLIRYSNQSDVCCYTRMYLRDKFRARYKENCNYGEQVLVAMQNLEYLENITLLPMVVYNYSPYPYPRYTLSNNAKGKEFDLMKKVMPEIQNVAKSMFPNNKYLISLSCLYLITSIYITAKNLIAMGEQENKIESVISNCLNDDMVQDIAKNVENNRDVNNFVSETITILKSNTLANQSTLTEKTESLVSLANRVSLGLLAAS